MGTANPYQVPRSNVDHHVEGDYSEVKVLSTKGRIGRLRYLGYSMGYSMLIYIIFTAMAFGWIGMGLPQGVLFAILGIGYVLLIIWTIMLTIQRAHDFNATGRTCSCSFWSIHLLNYLSIIIRCLLAEGGCS